MTAAIIDTISPDFMAAKRITVSVNKDCEPLMAFKRIVIDIDYTATEPEGVVLPLELIVQPGFGGGGPANGYRRKVFKYTAPESYTFTVPSSGDYLILVREIFHNKWQGSTVITVGGVPVLSDSWRGRS